MSSFSKSFINKEVEQQFLGGGDIVTRETYDPTSLNINNLGKAAVLHVAFTPFWSWGYAKLSL
jgi:hypothetical protein